jgi:hypothetical protein
MLRFTLQDAQNDIGLQKVSGVVPTSAEFIQLLNESQQRLIRRGTWFDTEFVVEFCVSGNIVSWPRFVKTVHGIRFAGGRSRPGQLFNNNFRFIGPHFRHHGFHCNAVIEDINSAPTTNEISGTSGKTLQYYTVLTSDIGKTITVFGRRFGGQPLMERDSNGNNVQGMTLVATAPYATSATLVTGIDAINRDATDGPAYLYEQDPATGLLRDLAWFEPGDTNPRFRRSKIVSKPFNCSFPDSNGICWTTIECLVKLNYTPALLPRDFLCIDNFSALKFMFQAIKYEEASNKTDAEACILSAIRELNFELREGNPDDQTSMRVSPVMGGLISNPI